MRRAAVFFDRDGVLNHAFVREGKPYPPQTLGEFQIFEGAADALQLLKASGFLLIVVTNQPDVTKGIQHRKVVDEMHSLLLQSLPLDAVRVCWCVEGPSCGCYKPKPGLLLEAARDYDVDLRRSFMIGDRWRDVGAGQAAGCRTVFIDRGYRESLRYLPDFICGDVSEAARLILAGTQRTD